MFIKRNIQMSKILNLVEHPLLKHKLGILRNKNTTTPDFREITKEISRILVYEAMRDWSDFEVEKIDTPVSRAEVERIKNPPMVISIMRAGNPMLDAVLSMIPFAPAGHIGIYRDKFIKNTVEYYFKIPEDHEGKEVFLCEPLIATADTAIAAIDRLKSYNVGRIKVLSILASYEGLKKLEHFHPDIMVFTLSVEKEVNELGYLMPGLGDAGDRLYQTR
jgi:uracil phosphoribosyltransferase